MYNHCRRSTTVKNPSSLIHLCHIRTFVHTITAPCRELVHLLGFPVHCITGNMIFSSRSRFMLGKGMELQMFHDAVAGIEQCLQWSLLSTDGKK